MSNSVRDSQQHIKLFIPGPVEVLPEILDAQAGWMFGHRMPEAADLIGRIQPKLMEVFKSKNPILIQAGTGSLYWEAAIRNLVPVGGKVLHAVSGAFSKKWAGITKSCGRDVTVIDFDWGKPVLAEPLAAELANGGYEMVAFVHNETSTGVTNPVQEIAAAIRAVPGCEDIIIGIDSVSGVSGAEIHFDDWDLDIVLTSSQKAFAMPPGLGMCAVSDRAYAKAETVEGRGYYGDFLVQRKMMNKFNTPNTSPLPMLMALDVQLDRMMAETIEGRWARHIAQRDITIDYFTSKGFKLYGDPAYASPTVSLFDNTLNMDIGALNASLRTKGMIISNGYGDMKNIAFRIAHMGDITEADLKALFVAIDEFLEQ